jgi:hypothetical protein
MKLRSIHFIPNVFVTIGGKHVNTSFWDREKHADIGCEEKNNGDVWLRWHDGPHRKVIRVVHKLAIAWRAYDVDDAK